MTEPDHIIEVICDDPRHARGKPAKIETFVRLVTGGDWLPAELLGERRQPHGWFHHQASGDLGELVHSYRCDLCPQRRPQQMECGRETLQWLLNAVADQGMSQTTLRVLNLIVSNRT